ncbi:hypothetical protein FHETE_10222 [Fusarium heterosporum]|uniref:Uncharacterized protein n=1 Tax=Fusarium heterosporum TaxID=42747 RepID=A0A8H5WF82_FUSHE|nr:hypothetical protein FHETE_10222 [Fusarium heterosporum]
MSVIVKSEDIGEQLSLDTPTPNKKRPRDTDKLATRISIKRPPALPTLEPYRNNAEFSKLWGNRRNELEKFAKTIKGPVRKEQTLRSNILLRIINHFQVPWEDVSFDEGSLELCWPGKFYHMRVLAKQGVMARLEKMEMPEHPDKRPRLQVNDFGIESPPRTGSTDGLTSHSEDTSNWTDAMEPPMATNIRQLLDEVKAKSSVWNDLELHIRSPSPCLGEARKHLQNVSNRLIYRMDKILAANNNNNNNFSGELEDVIRLMLLASGILRMHEVDLVDYTDDWEAILKMFHKIEPTASPALGAIKHNEQLDIEYIGPMLAPAITELKNSACITKQRALYTNIRTLLHGDMKASGHWVDG